MLGYPLFAGVLCLFGMAVLCMNWIGIVRHRIGGKTYSQIPFIGGLIASAGLLLVPRSRSLFWIPLVIDPSCVWLLCGLLLKWRKR
jgi:hypothetical protein